MHVPSIPRSLKHRLWDDLCSAWTFDIFTSEEDMGSITGRTGRTVRILVGTDLHFLVDMYLEFESQTRCVLRSSGIPHNYYIVDSRN